MDGKLATKWAVSLLSSSMLVSCGSLPMDKDALPDPEAVGKLSEIPIPVAVLDAVGRVSFEVAAKTSTLSEKKSYRRLLDKVQKRLVEAAQRGDGELAEVARSFSWDMRIIDNDAATATAFTGGGVIVHSGLFRLVKMDEGQLAVVLAHEMEHALHRHFEARMDKKTRDALLAAARTGEAVSSLGTDPALTAAIMAACGFVHGSQVPSPYAIPQELEADRESVGLLREAGYQPTEALAYLERSKAELEQRSPDERVALLDTHPPVEARIDTVRQQLQTGEIAAYTGVARKKEREADQKREPPSQSAKERARKR